MLLLDINREIGAREVFHREEPHGELLQECRRVITPLHDATREVVDAADAEFPHLLLRLSNV